ncbi:hypothetical protein Ae201684P_018131 [Aphanomyces euteiches]|uniref:Uncharacterized protein n=1 Tax=Aphanomyces euteiches TaxID=100861 RepID=A0A6G0X366_9STRA|nr:hypothetical protein Ae201684_008959 [Aphanomyces euteiches]KAH9054410.1 hypothetical protein Ae201684P_018131 [Aphanomyces euteiches]
MNNIRRSSCLCRPRVQSFNTIDRPVRFDLTVGSKLTESWYLAPLILSVVSAFQDNRVDFKKASQLEPKDSSNNGEYADDDLDMKTRSQVIPCS